MDRDHRGGVAWRQKAWLGKGRVGGGGSRSGRRGRLDGKWRWCDAGGGLVWRKGAGLGDCLGLLAWCILGRSIGGAWTVPMGFGW
jgi:hypothetical protein